VHKIYVTAFSFDRKPEMCNKLFSTTAARFQIGGAHQTETASMLRLPEKHQHGCPGPVSDWEEFCTCVLCELCGDPTQGKVDTEGVPICDECWPHLVADFDTATQD
jgi:hypothetical protein